LITRRCGDGDALAVRRNDRHHRPAGCALLDGLDGAFAPAVGGADRILRPRSAPAGVCIVGKLNAYSSIAGASVRLDRCPLPSHSRRSGRALITSGLPRCADLFRYRRHVRKVPTTDYPAIKKRPIQAVRFAP
jgi:hypothetical protein